MQTEFRRATGADFDAQMEIFSQAQAYLKQQDVDQWQNGYPPPALVQQDIEEGNSYVLTVDGRVAGTIAICFGEEPDYAQIHEGTWQGSGPYAALHRVAMAKTARGSGLADTMMQSALDLCRRAGVLQVRIDTHRHNQPMQHFLRRHGFAYRGIIYLTSDGAERFAFEQEL